MFSKKSIAEHLVSELKEKEMVWIGKEGKSFFVEVEPDRHYYGANGFFLCLWIDGEDTMEDIDRFLRGIWLECCGHMSAFYDHETRRKEDDWNPLKAMELLNRGDMKEYAAMMEEEAGEIPKNRKAADVLRKDLTLEYEYDFGSTTYLSLNIIEEFSIPAVVENMLLSRNAPLEILCQECEQAPAVELCSADGGAFCAKCAKKHAEECEDFADYAAMPVVNSPRMGVCAYDGGSIDQKRDKVFNIS
jgi:hypothetical protein